MPTTASFVTAALQIVGGLGLFLFGVEESSRSCQTALGEAFQDYLEKIISMRFGAFTFGVLLSFISQSSTIAVSFAVGLVDAGLLRYAGAVLVMVGASVGAPLTVFFLSFDIARWAPLMFVFFMLLAKTRGKFTRRIGTIGRGVALIFFGMYIIQWGVGTVVESESIRNMIVWSASSPFAFAGAAFVATLILQSSSAVMALVFALISSGAVGFAQAVPVVLGIHLGTAVPVFLASMGGRSNARRLGVLNLLYKIVGVALSAPFLFVVARALERLASPEATSLALMLGFVAVLNAAFFLPFTKKISIATLHWFRSSADSVGESYNLDPASAKIPDLALQLLSKEMERFARYLREYLYLLITTDSRSSRVDEFLEGLPELGKNCMRYLRSIRFPAGMAPPALYESLLYSLLGMRNLSRVFRKEFTPALRDGARDMPPLIERSEWSLGVRNFRDLVELALNRFIRHEGSSDPIQELHQNFKEIEKNLEERWLREGESPLCAHDLEILMAMGNASDSALEIVRGCETAERLEVLDKAEE